MTTRRISRTYDVIRRQMLKHASATIVPRGIVVPLDKFMGGSQRFARPLGSVFPILTPRNTMYPSAPIGKDTVSFTVDNLLPVIPIGSIISLQGEELQFVQDVDTDLNQITIESEAGFLTDYADTIKVYLHAVPINVSIAASAGDTFITVESDHILVHGDVLTEALSDGVGGSTIDIPSSDITVIDEITAPYTYTVSLESGLLKGYSVNDTIYLRAYPAYKSPKLTLPTQPGILGDNTGPFLWDFIEGRFHDGVENQDTGEPDPEAFIAIETYSPSLESQGPISRIDKNTVHLGPVIDSQFFAFWNRHMGTLLYESALTTITVDDEGDFLISQPLVPAWPSSAGSFYAGFKCTEDCNIRVGFHLQDTPAVPPTLPSSDYEWVESLQTIFFNLSVIGGAEATSTLIQMPDAVFDRIDVGGYSDVAGAKITLREWHFFSGIPTWVEYTIMGRANGDYTWGSSGLLLKPIFMSRDQLRQTNQADTGFVAF